MRRGDGGSERRQRHRGGEPVGRRQPEAAVAASTLPPSSSRLLLPLRAMVRPPPAAMARTWTLLCVPATARALREMAAEVVAAAALGANVAELRLNCLSGFAPAPDHRHL
ncbi:hypothetical protein E2562_037199 [Oryza meyeriana var. granulata]|uniref:Uncharacterized protein n=1 Tax=Oryza meyeriana var. granulata TaxID=110450 RepID=A0A6G1DCX9_9ORYZ|nr:hypothetical protein E2562_037199 [Oryza meyeriana var. granulata]